MAIIRINDVQLAGQDFFTDSDSFLSELSHDDQMFINGGATPTIIATVKAVAAGAAAGAAISAAAVGVYQGIRALFD
jgi:hypothetical protein